jgi:coproporphyrinogen III oxidase
MVHRRYFETAEWEGIPSQWWYGGGTDITPAYVYDEDMKHFHGSYKQVCDAHDPEFYHKFRTWYATMHVTLLSLCFVHNLLAWFCFER